MSNCAAENNSPSKAAVLFQRLVRAEPSNATYHYDLGVSALASHDTGTARRELAVLRKLNPLGVNDRKIAQLSILIDETAGAHAKHD